jgi:hypothetical protein
MKPNSASAQSLIETLKKKRILTLKELCETAKRSTMTVWRILKPIGYRTSFNFNARYYTLTETAKFDTDGLWFCRDVGFSSFGNLNRTIVGFVNRSTMGMTPNELSTILRVRVQNQLHHLFASNQVEQAKWGRSHVFLSVEKELREEQLRRRKASQEKTPSTETVLTESETIAILAELVRTARAPARRIAAILASRGLEITTEKVLTVIEKYDLGLKKGRYRRSKP